jgi:hypothetical protein
MGQLPTPPSCDRLAAWLNRWRLGLNGALRLSLAGVFLRDDALALRAVCKGAACGISRSGICLRATGLDIGSCSSVAEGDSPELATILQLPDSRGRIG